ncbi:MAG: trypsin-like peptidase domain-containing protein [Candidatus Izemoplasmatales bacterium]|jgi:serine protease Do|nr:trypsin-like peptidase domain-containing protein [Candidatus Izemoplasmatales bacterium]MDD4595114.1 trypsin-like peptidase domain-containing protein [Candidatus Izemoplasmatales bacterium]
MKKHLVLIVIAIMVLGLWGCDFFTSYVTVPLTTGETTEEVTTTSGVISIDIDAVISELYNRIYIDLYDDVRAEVIDDLSQERFDAIYAQVIADVVAKIDADQIEISVQSIVEQIFLVASEKSAAVIGVSNYTATNVLQSFGSGIIYKHTGDTYFVVTNNHVVEDGTYFEIEFADGTTIEAHLKGVDDLVDVAVLYFTSAEELPVASFGDSETVNKGDVILAVGNPSSYDFYNSMTLGIVSGIDRYFDIDSDNIKDMFVNYIQHDAAINAGNSGGALFNLNGEVIGINVIKIASVEIEGMGFAIPSNLVEAICEDIELYGISKQKPVLGITFYDIDTVGVDVLYTEIGIVIPDGIEYGFYVSVVKDGSTMDGIALEGDIILQIGDIVISNLSEYVEAFSKYRVDDVITVVLYRDGETLTFENVVLKPKSW